MPVATCPSGADLNAYACGELPSQSEDWLAGHLDTCPQCRATVQNLERQADPLLARLRAPVKPDPFQEEPECREVIQRLLALPIGSGGQAAQSPGAQRAPVSKLPVAKPLVAQSSAAVPHPLASLGRFQEYDLLEKLGKGGMGAVYKARHRRLGKLVAIKILPPRLAQDPERVARFKREMKAVGQTRSSAHRRAVDAGEVDSRHYLVMEYVEGLDLLEDRRSHRPAGRGRRLRDSPPGGGRPSRPSEQG